jgi:hypothetical protein
MLSLFFAVVALILAGVGLYGALSYSVRSAGVRSGFVWRWALARPILLGE